MLTQLIFLGIAFSKQVLSHGGIDFKDGKTLCDSNSNTNLIRFEKEPTIDLRFVGQIKLYVKTLMRTTYWFVVNSSDTVESLKIKIQDKKGIMKTF